MDARRCISPASPNISGVRGSLDRDSPRQSIRPNANLSPPPQSHRTSVEAWRSAAASPANLNATWTQQPPQPTISPSQSQNQTGGPGFTMLSGQLGSTPQVPASSVHGITQARTARREPQSEFDRLMTTQSFRDRQKIKDIASDDVVASMMRRRLTESLIDSAEVSSHSLRD